MQLQFTQYFDEAYRAFGDRDATEVDAMLDRLEVEHEQPHMRNVITVGSVALFATPRFEGPGGTYRITWQYDESGQPTIITCVTVAKADRKYPT
ncbi:MAG: hypothetical protein ACNYZH_10460 [Acidimicrobiia bacterium]